VIQIIRPKHSTWKNHKTQFITSQIFKDKIKKKLIIQKGLKQKKITIKKTMIKIKGEPKKKNQSNKTIQKQNQRERVSK
jgi:hypothetical protein